MTDVIKIDISGPAGSGKTAVMHRIREMLEGDNYCVAIPDSALRINSRGPFAAHERPHPDDTVFVLTESVIGHRRTTTD